MERENQMASGFVAGGRTPGTTRAKEAEAVRQAASARLRSLIGASSVDDETARLVFDSYAEARTAPTVRSSQGSARQLSFEAHGLQLDMEVLGGRLVGQLVPPQRAVVELRHRAGTASVTTDELGWFHVARLPEGPISFRCTPDGSPGAPVATSWLKL